MSAIKTWNKWNVLRTSRQPTAIAQVDIFVSDELFSGDTECLTGARHWFNSKYLKRSFRFYTQSTSVDIQQANHLIKGTYKADLRTTIQRHDVLRYPTHLGFRSLPFLLEFFHHSGFPSLPNRECLSLIQPDGLESLFFVSASTGVLVMLATQFKQVTSLVILSFKPYFSNLKTIHMLKRIFLKILLYSSGGQLDFHQLETPNLSPHHLTLIKETLLALCWGGILVCLQYSWVSLVSNGRGGF